MIIVSVAGDLIVVRNMYSHLSRMKGSADLITDMYMIFDNLSS